MIIINSPSYNFNNKLYQFLCFCSCDSILSYRSCILYIFCTSFSNSVLFCWGICLAANLSQFCVSAPVTAIYLTGFSIVSLLRNSVIYCTCWISHSRRRLASLRCRGSPILDADWIAHSGRRLLSRRTRYAKSCTMSWSAGHRDWTTPPGLDSPTTCSFNAISRHKGMTSQVVVNSV